MTSRSQRSDLSDGAQHLAQHFACGEDKQAGGDSNIAGGKSI